MNALFDKREYPENFRVIMNVCLIYLLLFTMWRCKQLSIYNHRVGVQEFNVITPVMFNLCTVLPTEI